MITVSLENFQTEVVQASQTQPILIDFASPRSPASNDLTTVLLRLEAAFGGAFTLATVNCDLYPQIAGAFQVQQVPTTILFMQGQPVDGFSGALPEAQIQAFLNKHVQAIAMEPAEVLALQAARQASAAGELLAAISHTRKALEANPAFDEARLDLVDLLIDGNPKAAQDEFEKINASSLDELQLAVYTALKTALAEHAAAALAALESPELQALKAQVVITPKDCAARLALANAYKASKAYELALEQLLAVVETDRAFAEEAGRKGMVEVFALAADTPDLVRAWRQKLSRALN